MQIIMYKFIAFGSLKIINVNFLLKPIFFNESSTLKSDGSNIAIQ